MYKGETIVKAIDDQLCAQFTDGELVILSLSSGTYYGLNSVGAHIWQLLQQPRTIDEITKILIEEYDVERCCCEEELLALISDLDFHELVIFKNGTSS